MFRFRLRISKQIKEKVVFMMATSGSITCNSLDDFLELSNGGSYNITCNNVDYQCQEHMEL